MCDALNEPAVDRFPEEVDFHRPNRSCSSTARCRVLLVDDIVTTGTTLSVAAELLREAGARVVYAVALLHTERST